MARKKEADEGAAKREEFLAEEIRKPLKYVMHDANAHDDPKLQDLRDDHGFAALGRWWLLVELLAGRVDHCYDVSRAHGWERLAHDLEFGRSPEAVEECRGFIAALLGLGLLERSSYSEFEHIRSARIDRNAAAVAEEIAGKRYAVWCRERKRAEAQER